MEKGMSDMTENNNFQNRQEQNGNPEKKAASFPVYNNIYDAFSQGDGNRTAQETAVTRLTLNFHRQPLRGIMKSLQKEKNTVFDKACGSYSTFMLRPPFILLRNGRHVRGQQTFRRYRNRTGRQVNAGDAFRSEQQYRRLKQYRAELCGAGQRQISFYC